MVTILRQRSGQQGAAAGRSAQPGCPDRAAPAPGREAAAGWERGAFTWLPRDAGFAFAFSAVPELGASASAPLARVERPDPTTGRPTRVLAPVVMRGAGARFAVNEHGLGLCLLGSEARTPSREACEAGRAAPPASHASELEPHPGAQGRGQLLLELSGCHSEFALGAHLLSGVRLEVYRPFLLASFSPGRHPTFFEWDGHRLGQRLALRAPLACPTLASGDASRRRWPPRSLRGRPVRPPRRTEDLLRFHESLGFRRFGPAGGGGVPARRLWLVVVDSAAAHVESFEGATEEPASSRVHSLPLASAPAARAPATAHLRAPSRTYDVPSLFAERGRGPYARLPRWVLQAIAGAVGQGAVNRFLFGLGAMPAEAFPEACLRQLGVEARVRYTLPCELEAPPVYVANHPLGGVDGLALLALALRRHGRTQAPVNPLLTRIPHLAELCVPLDAERDPRGLPAILRRVFQSEQPIALFPAGSASRRSNGVLADAPWAPMVVSYCLRYRRPLVPVFIGGHNSAKFYAMAAARRRLGIGVNLEMFLLPREALAPVVRRLDMHVGPPIASQELAGLGATNLERAAALRERCYALGQGP